MIGFAAGQVARRLLVRALLLLCCGAVLTMATPVNAQNSVRLKQGWVGPIPNDAVNLTISGSVTSPVAGSSAAGAPSQTDATAPGTTGGTVNFTEAFTTGSAASYTITFACSRDSTGTAVTTGGSGTNRTVVMPAYAITCTFTATRALPTGALPPTWTGVKVCPAANTMATARATQVGWNYNWPVDTMDQDEKPGTDFVSSFPTGVGPGITFIPFHTAGVARLVDSMSSAQAFSAGDYVEYKVTTNSNPDVRSPYALRWGVNNENQWTGGYPYKFSVIMSLSSSFATAQTVLPDQQIIFNTTSGYIPYTVAVAPGARVILQPDTTYYFRVLLHTTSANPNYNTAIWDDFAIITANCETQSLQLTKSWTNGRAGHQATATTSGAINTNATFTSTAPAANSGTPVAVFRGETITLPAETFGGGATTAMYAATVQCTGGSPLANGATGRSITIQDSATATVCAYTNNNINVALNLVKSSVVVNDPINGTTNPKAIPGATIDYTIGYSNADPGTADANTLIISDLIPANVSMFVGDLGVAGSGPVAFTNGAPGCGVSYNFVSLSSTTDSLEFSDNGGATWVYVPSGPYDAAINGVRISLLGSLAGTSGTSTACTLRFRALVK